MKYPLALAIIFTMAFGLTPGTAAAGCPGADVPVTDPVVSRSALLCLANEQRAAAGVAPLSVDPRLLASAQLYAERLVAGRFFSHVDPAGGTFSDRLRASGYDDGRLFAAGENLGWKSGSPTPRAMISAWLGSASHRANLLDPRYRDTGVGVTAGTPAGMAGVTFVHHLAFRVAASASARRGLAAPGQPARRGRRSNRGRGHRAAASHRARDSRRRSAAGEHRPALSR